MIRRMSEDNSQLSGAAFRLASPIICGCCSIVVYADDILLIAIPINRLQSLFNSVCESELLGLNRTIN